MKRSLPAIVAVLLAFATVAAHAADGVEIKWFGQSAVKLTTPGGKVIVIDPFITQNPVTPKEDKDLAKIGKVDLILVTHAHGDHWGDTAALAKMTGAPVALNADFGNTIAALGLVPRDQIIGFNKSGPIHPLGKDITITMVHAEHSSDFVYTKDGRTTVFPGGEPAGYIVRLENGYTIWHMGDTGVFGDMAWIAEYYQPDLVLVPIGGHYTMDPEHAAYAVNDLIGPDMVVPIHYGTFPALEGTPARFEDALGDTDAQLVVMKPGETRAFP